MSNVIVPVLTRSDGILLSLLGPMVRTKQFKSDSSYAVQGKIGGVWAGVARPNTPILSPTA